MTELEERVKDLLEERSRDHNADPVMPRSVATRSRRRRTLVGTGAGVGVLAVIVLGAAAFRAFAPPSEPGITPTPESSSTAAVEPWRGIWPQATREEGEVAQAAVDAGDPGAGWQLEAGVVARRYARQKLGFARVYFDESFDIAEEDSPGPFLIHVISCGPRDLVEWPPVCADGQGVYSEITIERLLRPDWTGLWFVTEALEPAPAQRVQPSPSASSGYPTMFVGLTNDRDLVLVRLADGAVARTLLEGEGLELTLGAGAVTPDGSFIHVTDWAGREPRILRVPIVGGPPVEVAAGSSPTVGSDGRIAYSGCGESCGTALFVESEDGAMVRFDVSASDEERIGALAWLPDGRIALSVSYLGDSNPDVRLLDPDDPPRYLLDLLRLGPADPGAGWRPLGWHRPTDGLAVDSYCCTGFANDPVEVEAVLSVDPATEETDPAIVEGPGSERLSTGRAASSSSRGSRPGTEPVRSSSCSSVTASSGRSRRASWRLPGSGRSRPREDRELPHTPYARIVHAPEPGGRDRPIDGIEVVDERAEASEPLLAEAEPPVGDSDGDPVEATYRADVDGRRVRVDRAGCPERVREERVDARVAAEHPVQRHHVVGSELRHRSVAGGERGPVGEPTLGRERSRLGDRAAGQVDPGGVVRASREGREREVARPAAHVEHRSRLEALTIQRFEHPAGDRRAHPSTSCPRRAVRRPLVEAARLLSFRFLHDRSVVPLGGRRQPASGRRGAVIERGKSLAAALCGLES